ncbi:DnaA ATPase domain-containing protein [Methylobacterium gnaphalii]|uniref:Chromosomal replication initiator protein DnaA n=1 Tax=Methylobacterium gnaphalii TaxID=1010610 RepID=A0A512JP46_9HYPH|nr:DnaA/Hda family protein [Methylobacterium gnaphalii]GEP11712.1 chromosomal replication initiator protein DnaA [Methylobacterium gnaphalii]GJD68774.1 Chromosomal replication initiator protein DnaA [Methylobacterium gnaphalii]GLS50209.1 chromosomal replication initiator protein DnaA [Methylobacterium gnaphalii]
MRDKAPPKQLAFDLPLDPRYGREDFLVGPANEAAYALVEAWPDWPDTVLLLQGPRGSGKSHLASIWATRAHAWTVSASTLKDDQVTHLVSNGALVIEDVDRAADRDEAALFHLLNLARERHSPVMITAARPVDSFGLKVADLRSRLRLAPTIEILPPDDALLRAVIVKLFVDRQIVVDLAVVEAVALRIDRSLARARDVVAELDRDALGRGRRITKPLALAVLDRLGMAEAGEDADEQDEETG